jgi:hypothetical protein
MDDTSRGLKDEEMRGRGDETTRNYAGPASTPPSVDRTTSPPASTTARTRSAGTTDTDEETDQRTREIRAEIEQTREDMSETIDAIQEKLRPANIVAEAKDRVKNATTERVRQMADTASETAQNAMEQTRHLAGDVVEGARNNAIPAAMIGIGIAWLLVDRYRERSQSDSRYRRYDSSYRTPAYYETDDYYRSTQASAYGSGYRSGHEEQGANYRRGASGEFDSSAASRVTETAADLRDRTMRTTRRARNQFQRLLHENPLMVGAAAIVVGAAVGMALPETERENEWLGETRDNVLEKAQDAARDAATRAQEAVGDAAGEVAKKVVGAKE